MIMLMQNINWSRYYFEYDPRFHGGFLFTRSVGSDPVWNLFGSSYYTCPVFYIIKWTYFCQTKSYHACSSSTRCTRSTNKRCTTCTRSTRCTDIPTICLANTYYTSPDAQRMRKMLFGICQSISATPQQRVICITP